MINCYSVILRAASLLIPHCLRTEWFAEWNGELWYVLRTPGSLKLSFCLGAFQDALWLRRNPCSEVAPGHAWLQSPWKTLCLLACLAAASTGIFLYAVDPVRAPHTYREYRVVILDYLFLTAVAFLLTSVTSSLSLGEYPEAPSSPARARRFYRWAFLAMKFLLIGPIVLFGTYDIVKLLSSARPMALHPHASLVLFVIAFRWALHDQRRRCPVCLRLLNESASIGQFSHNFLEWYGRELFCIKGHGLLHVPEIATTYSAQRWCDLDRSWSVLFP
jgi:hypothetical protein